MPPAVTLAQLNQLRTTLRCDGGCEHPLDTPHVMPCGHTYCRRCLQKKVSRSSKCPRCLLPVGIRASRVCGQLGTIVKELELLIQKCDAAGDSSTSFGLGLGIPPPGATPSGVIGAMSPPARPADFSTTQGILLVPSMRSPGPSSTVSRTPETLLKDPEGFVIPPLSPQRKLPPTESGGGGATSPVRQVRITTPEAEKGGFRSSGSPEVECHPPPGSELWKNVGGAGSQWDICYRELLERCEQVRGGGAELATIKQIDTKLAHFAGALKEKGFDLNTETTPIVTRSTASPKRKYEDNEEEDTHTAKRLKIDDDPSVSEGSILSEETLDEIETRQCVVTTTGLYAHHKGEVEASCLDIAKVLKEEKSPVSLVHRDMPNTLEPELTHLITVDRSPLTPKYVFALLRGVWIVSSKWLADPARFAPGVEASYEVRGAAKEGQFPYAPRKARLARQAREEGKATFLFEGRELPSLLMKGFRVDFVGDFTQGISKEELTSICTLAGAVVGDETKLDGESLEHLVVWGGMRNSELAKSMVEVTGGRAIPIKSLMDFVAEWGNTT